MKHLWTLGLALSIAIPAAATAQDNGSLRIEGGVFHDSEIADDSDFTATVSRLQLDGDVRLTDHLQLELDAAAAHAHIDLSAERSGWAFGNPRVGFGLFDERDNLRFTAGVGFVVPVLERPELGFKQDELPDTLVATLAGLTTGGIDPWLWVSDRWSLTVPVRFDYETERFRGAFGVEMAAMVSTDRDNTDTVRFLYQSELEGALRLGAFEVGSRVRVAHELDTEGDGFQSSAEPFVGLNSGIGRFDASFTMLLDGEASTFEKDGVWSANAGYTAEF